MTLRQLSFFFSLLSLSALLPAQEPAPEAVAAASARASRQDLLKAPVLQQEGQTYRVSDVLARLYPLDPNLEPALTGSLEYLQVYLDSPRFYDQVRWYSNLLLLEAVQVPEVTQEALNAEAVAWAKDRGIDAPANAALAIGGLEILVRAKMIGEQPDVLAAPEVRKHFNRSIPEFFGRVKLSWIRLPLFDDETGRALGETERHARYLILDEAAKEIQTGKITWEEAVEKHSQDRISKRQQGRVGYVMRTDHRFDEEFLRQLFLDLGVTAPPGAVMRGPIMGSRWVYLARMEKITSVGVVEMNRVKDRVERSLRTYMIYQELDRLAAGVSRGIQLPVRTK